MSPELVLAATGGVGGWALAGWLFRYVIRSQATGYADRVADLKAHGDEKTTILRDQLATGAKNADSFDRVATGVEATQKLVEALPAVLRERAS